MMNEERGWTGGLRLGLKAVGRAGRLGAVSWSNTYLEFVYAII
jgi:hypothetical protein